MASRTLTATYRDGTLELAEALTLRGDQVTVTIHDADGTLRRLGVPMRRLARSTRGRV